MINKKYLYIPFLLYSFTCLDAQELVTGLPSMPYKPQSKQLKSAKKVAASLSLPFFDDFSNRDGLPNNKYWQDDYVYINQTFEVDPISTGVATFDALNDKGWPYISSSGNNVGADTLTSQPIDLSSKQNVYLSFYYQPQGTGDAPEKSDSLILDFFSPEDTSWTTVWKAEGDTLQPFKLVMVRVDNTKHLQDGFIFRFRNIVSLKQDSEHIGYGGNADIWNLDYVYLNDNRNENDTIPGDFVFPEKFTSILTNYDEIPWRHVEAAHNSEFSGSKTVKVRSVSEEGGLFALRYTFTDVFHPSNTLSYLSNFINIYPFDIILVKDPLEYDFVSEGKDGIAKFNIDVNLELNDVLINRKENDTLHFIQEFKDYYAYDDGSAELAYGFRRAENPKFACKFHTYKTDTLKRVYIYFNHVMDSSNNDLAFYLTVWDVNEVTGTPGTILYQKEAKTNALTNGFVQYDIDDIDLIVSNDFFIGWQQESALDDYEYFNVGLDHNNNSRDNAYYKLSSIWEKSQVDGAVMIRPGFGAKLYTGITKPNPLGNPGFTIFPNPSKNYFTVKSNKHFLDEATIRIMDLQGRVLIENVIPSFPYTIYHSLNKGIFIYQIETSGLETQTGKIIVTN